jgi:hypothetical protein
VVVVVVVGLLSDVPSKRARTAAAWREVRTWGLGCFFSFFGLVVLLWPLKKRLKLDGLLDWEEDSEDVLVLLYAVGLPGSERKEIREDVLLFRDSVGGVMNPCSPVCRRSGAGRRGTSRG